MLKEDITQKRKERHHITQEDFTPNSVIEDMLALLDDETIYTDFSKTVLDPCSGIGNILIYIFKKRLEYCKTDKDVYAALSTIYGTELMEDNVEESHDKFLSVINDIDIVCDNNEIMDILKKNIVCADTFKWDYENWCPLPIMETQPLF